MTADRRRSDSRMGLRSHDLDATHIEVSSQTERVTALTSVQGTGSGTVKSTDRLVGTTNDLVNATKRLGTITIWLVGGAVLMGFAAVADVILKLKGVLH